MACLMFMRGSIESEPVLPISCLNFDRQLTAKFKSNIGSKILTHVYFTSACLLLLLLSSNMSIG